MINDLIINFSFPYGNLLSRCHLNHCTSKMINCDGEGGRYVLQINEVKHKKLLVIYPLDLIPMTEDRNNAFMYKYIHIYIQTSVCTSYRLVSTHNRSILNLHQFTVALLLHDIQCTMYEHKAINKSGSSRILTLKHK